MTASRNGTPSAQYRWQAGVGAITGALVGGSLARGSDAWTPGGVRAIEIAESLLAGGSLPIDTRPHEAIPAAVGLASGQSPLLAEPTTVALIDAVRDSLERRDHRRPSDPLLAKAAELADSLSFVDAAEAAGGDPELAALVGAFAGLRGGLGAVPARLVCTTGSPDGRRGRRYLGALTNRLLGLERPKWYDPRSRRGPREVLPGVWVSNLYGVRRFASAHVDGLILSLCDDEGQVGAHPHHLTFHLEDIPRTDANPSLGLVVDDVLGEIGAARERDQPVLVHCRHGASRTGLILRLLLVDELGLSAEDALTEALCLWPHTSTWNDDWTREVERRAAR